MEPLRQKDYDTCGQYIFSLVSLLVSTVIHVYSNAIVGAGFFVYIRLLWLLLVSLRYSTYQPRQPLHLNFCIS